jgi:hypothetical protein
MAGLMYERARVRIRAREMLLGQSKGLDWREIQVLGSRLGRSDKMCIALFSSVPE